MLTGEQKPSVDRMSPCDSQRRGQVGFRSLLTEPRRHLVGHKARDVEVPRQQSAAGVVIRKIPSDPDPEARGQRRNPLESIGAMAQEFLSLRNMLPVVLAPNRGSD